MSKLLWKPSEDQIKRTNMYRFMNFVNEKYKQEFSDYTLLYEWSIENIPQFWAAMWEFADIIASKSSSLSTASSRASIVICSRLVHADASRLSMALCLAGRLVFEMESRGAGRLSDSASP